LNYFRNFRKNCNVLYKILCFLSHLTLYTQPLKMELIQGSETSANYNLTPGKYPEENIQLYWYISFACLALINFTFRLLCIIIDFFLNNQPHALIIPIVSGILSAHHQEFSIVHSAPVKFHAGFWWPLPSRVRMDEFQPDSAWKRSPETCMKLTSAECTVGNSWWWVERIPETCRTE